MVKRRASPADGTAAIAHRLYELLVANSGSDPFEEALKLIVLWAYNSRAKKDREESAQDPRKGIENANRVLAEAVAEWPDILVSDHISLTDEHFSVCFSVLQSTSISFDPVVLDDIFEYIVSREAKSTKGQFFTPRHVIDLCLDLVSPKKGETLVDPACGSGAFLTHALKRSSVAPTDVWGFDYDERATRVARLSLYLSGVDQPNIHHLNSLECPASLARRMRTLFSKENLPNEDHSTIEALCSARRVQGGRFDIVVANPPFAGEVRERELLDAYTVSSGKSHIERDALFLERCVMLIRPGGRFALVLPHSLMSNVKWRPLRQWFLKNCSVTTVVGLGRNTFLPHTHQKAVIATGMRRRSNAPRCADEAVRFIVSDKPGKDSRGQLLRAPNNPDMIDHDFADILSLARS